MSVKMSLGNVFKSLQTEKLNEWVDEIVNLSMKLRFVNTF